MTDLCLVFLKYVDFWEFFDLTIALPTPVVLRAGDRISEFVLECCHGNKTDHYYFET